MIQQRIEHSGRLEMPVNMGSSKQFEINLKFMQTSESHESGHLMIV